MSGRFDGEKLATRRLAADIANRFEQEAVVASKMHATRQRKHRATKEYYAEQNGCWMTAVAMVVLLTGALVLWINECAQREKADIQVAINTLRNNARSVDDLRDEHILRAVQNAERRLNRSLLFAVGCRVVTDSFLVSGMSDYESTFRRSLESALQQHWFLLALCVTVIAGFFASAIVLFYMTCTRRLWCGGSASRFRSGHDDDDDDDGNTKKD